ncbi:MAG: hypothetical protein QMD36_03710 [Candidatus Aenigmarchaeota archaeon]|nr:hypothetical protein [Candidatus Aenigmarchaeota archaeon]
MRLIAELENQDTWTFLDEEKLRGSSTRRNKYIRINETILPEEALIIGWLLSKDICTSTRFS